MVTAGDAALAAELDERLPALRAALTATPARGAEAQRHARTLASSAAVLGQVRAAALLRAAQTALLDGDASLPLEVARAGRLVDRAAVLLLGRNA